MSKAIYARWKQSWAKPKNEDEVISHLSYMGLKTFCKIENRHPDVYNYGNAPIIEIEGQSNWICKGCFKKWKAIKDFNNQKD